LYAPPPWAETIKNLPLGEMAKWRGKVADSERGCTPNKTGLGDCESIRYAET
jgi:hypothetical protein